MDHLQKTSVQIPMNDYDYDTPEELRQPAVKPKIGIATIAYKYAMSMIGQCELPRTKTFNNDYTQMLISLCKSRNADTVSVLHCLENGADPNVEWGKTLDRPLHAFSRQGNYMVMKYLVQAGADINALNGMVQTALMNACDTTRTDRGQLNVIRYLLSVPRVKVDVVDVGGNTALLNAIFRNNVYVTKYVST